MRSTTFLALMLTGSVATVANPATNALAAPWKDVANCMAEAKGKVTSAKDATVMSKPGVLVTAKADNGSKKPLTAGIQGAKASDFPTGSAFCKIDFGAD